jgi:PAS domain S-box-containing protein
VGRLSTEVYGTGQPPYLNEFSKVALSGEPYHCESYFQPMDKHFSISVISPEKYRFATVTTDITDHKQAEEALQKSEDSLQAVLNSTADGILAVGKDNKVLYANERFSELWRIPSDILKSGDDSILLQHILDQLSDPEGFLKKVQELYINDKESFDVINFHDGRVYERLSRPLSAKSEVKGRVWSFRDVTERKKAEEEYLKFFTITENSLYGSAIADPDGNLVYVNDYFAHIHGYKVKELIGRKLDIFHSDDQMPLVRKTIEDALEKGSIESIEIHHLHKNGHEFTMLMSLAVIKDPDDKPKYIAATAFDLTEQKTFEQKLQNTVNDQNLMLDNDPTLIFFKDCKNNIIRVTESVAKATGMTREAIEGRPSKEIYPDMADQYWEDDMEVINSGKPKLNIIEPLTGADGSSHWLLTNKIPVKNNSGEIVGVTVFATDITELKNAELGLIAAKEKAERNEIELVKAQEIAHLGSWYLNTETNEVTWTEELYKMYGFDPAMPPPPYTEHMKLFTPESWEILSTSLAKTRETGVPYELELKTIRNDNSNGWMWVRGEAVVDKDNRITGLWGAAQDITERMKTEKALMMKMDELERYFKLTVGRELTMVELKKEVNNLLNKLGEDNKYKIVE